MIDKKILYILCLISILLIFTVDALTPVSLRLGVLYLFPVFLVTYINGQKWPTRFLVGMAVVCQVVTLFSFDIPLTSKIIESIIKPGAIYLVFILSKKLRKTHLKLVDISNKDCLTGLLSRRKFYEILEQEITRQRRYGGVLSLVILDLDKFKHLNDTRGHPIGDEALLVLSDVLRASIRQTDTIARLGGDEFALLLLHTNTVDCGVFCHNISKKIKHKMAVSGFNITASMGYASFNAPPESAVAAIAKVDALMYAAKNRGQGCVFCELA
jgi:diguanylate cyclase (GGDEF)-like protein